MSSIENTKTPLDTKGNEAPSEWGKPLAVVVSAAAVIAFAQLAKYSWLTPSIREIISTYAAGGALIFLAVDQIGKDQATVKQIDSTSSSSSSSAGPTSIVSCVVPQGDRKGKDANAEWVATDNLGQVYYFGKTSEEASTTCWYTRKDNNSDAVAVKNKRILALLTSALESAKRESREEKKEES